LTTWENPKDEEGLKKYYDQLNKNREYMNERRKKFNIQQSGWSDGTGKLYNLDIFESYADYAEYMDDLDFQKTMINFFRHVNNADVKILRESIWVPT
jgi:hypothetical protein